MGWGSPLKALFKIGTKNTIVLTGKDAVKFMEKFGGKVGKNAVKFGDDAAKVIVKAGPAIGNGVKAISAGAVALGAAIIAGLSGFIGYLMSNNKVLGPLSMMDLLLIVLFLIALLLIIRKVRDRKEESVNGNYRKKNQDYYNSKKVR